MNLCALPIFFELNLNKESQTTNDNNDENDDNNPYKDKFPSKNRNTVWLTYILQVHWGNGSEIDGC